MELQDEIQRMIESQEAKIKLRPTKLLMHGYPGETIEQFRATVKSRWPFLEENHADRLVDAYGGRVDRVLGTAVRIEDIGPDLGHTLTAAEVRYLMQHEWAETADDVLWRRTKLGLKFSRPQKEALA